MFTIIRTKNFTTCEGLLKFCGVPSCRVVCLKASGRLLQTACASSTAKTLFTYPSSLPSCKSSARAINKVFSSKRRTDS